MIVVSHDPIDLDGLYRALESPHAGGTVVFTGTVRDLNAGKQVHFLDFEAYPEMAVHQMEAIADEIRARWEVTHVAMVHRLGHTEIGDMVVAIGVSAPHRDAAFQGCRHGIDRLKEVVPIWKRETFEGGEAWLSNHP
jgi:molybdopterin synthase catalytic subunit